MLYVHVCRPPFSLVPIQNRRQEEPYRLFSTDKAEYLRRAWGLTQGEPLV